MKKAISIGINRAEGMPPLNAAVTGARDFAAWAQSQRYQTSVFTDDEGAVSRGDIFREINTCVKAGNCDQMLIFFAGHGVLRGPGQETWLLSAANDDPAEAVNVPGSIDNARTSRIPYIVFISDACRVLPTSIKHTGNGSPIFPVENDMGKDSAVDVFYATRPGSPALELNGDDATRRFGIFTRCLLDVLTGKKPDRVSANNDATIFLPKYYDVALLRNNMGYKKQDAGWQLISDHIMDDLKNMVEDKVFGIDPSKSQTPQIRLEVLTPKPFLSRFEDDIAKQLLLAAAPEEEEEEEHGVRIPGTGNLDLVMDVDTTLDAIDFESIDGDSYSRIGKPSYRKYKTSRLPVEAGTDKISIGGYWIDKDNYNKILSSKARKSFETHTGFTVIGQSLSQEQVIVGGDRPDVFNDEKNGGVHIRIWGEPNSVLLILENGESIPLAVLQGFIGTVIFKGGNLLTVNYTPSEGNYEKFIAYERYEQDIIRARALVACAANEGFDYTATFKQEFDSTGHIKYDSPGSFLRQEKSLDPSLGMYAAYAYKQSGGRREIDSIFGIMRQEQEAMLYDVAALANKINTDSINSGRLAPFCPMMSLGWAYEDSFRQYLHPALQGISRHLVPGLWTRFDKEATLTITQLIKNKEL